MAINGVSGITSRVVSKPENPILSSEESLISKEPPIKDYCVGRSGLPSFAVINGKVYPADSLKVVDAENVLVGKLVDRSGKVVSEKALITGNKACLSIKNKDTEQV